VGDHSSMCSLSGLLSCYNPAWRWRAAWLPIDGNTRAGVDTKCFAFVYSSDAVRNSTESVNVTCRCPAF